MIVLDVTIVNVALPSIKDDLGFSQSGLAWVVNAYLIPFGGLLLLAGRLGDLIGKRRIFLSGLAVFIVASLLCAVAQTQGMLIGARFLQGIGGALASAVVLGMIVTMFPEKREQAKAIGVYGFVASAGGSIGLLAGGILTEAISWHWIFFINVPIGIATAFFALRLIEDSPGIGLTKGADVPGAIMLIGCLMIGTYSILGVNRARLDLAQTLILSAVSIAMLAAFVVRQARIETPLMPLRLFHSRNVSACERDPGAARRRHVLDVLPRRSLPAADPRVRRARGRSRFPADDGGDGDALARLLGKADHALRARGTTLIPGVAIIAIGLLLFARTPVDGNYLVDLMPPMLLVGLGVGTSFPSLMTLAMSGATPEDAGLASGVVNTSVQVGGAIGLAVLATLATAAHREPPEADGIARNGGAQLRLPPRLSGRRGAGRSGAGALRSSSCASPTMAAMQAQAEGAGPEGERTGAPEREPAYSDGDELIAPTAGAQVPERASRLNSLSPTVDRAESSSEAPYDERSRMGRISGWPLDRRCPDRDRRHLPARRLARGRRRRARALPPSSSPTASAASPG